MKKLNITLLLLLPAMAALAADDKAEAATVSSEPSLLGLSQAETLLLIMLLFVLVLLVVSITLLNAFKVMYREQLNPTPYLAPVKEAALDYDSWLKTKKHKPSIWSKILGLKPIEAEKDIVIEHAYDGIQELNNPVPAWFNFLFYGTILFGAAYLFYYYIGGYGLNQDQLYEAEMTRSAEEKAIYLQKSANAIDENTVKADNAAPIIESGKTIFSANCAVCHGPAGGGLIGPNLTDEFWLHGGGINNIFKTIKYGVPAKGMVSWEKTLSPKQISEVANYILSLEGSKPAGAKAPQGEKYEPNNEVKDAGKK
ncbi:cbb3-type cytochrome c oxidase N-terminal domain-containing protein [Pedobacter soli]|uniref:Cytochrome c oxidase cbb3-type subunit 3 n=1 Tax=Pedobacter soli TaxID=390242 RepID=A0A1G6JPG1_9SPHI|nr:cbb3-type cytochrome c oxidase N-terminal domain-containing protein [Pedobacter soli]SDC20325.1 cytochrome c oxidase cbb3-type subunit 3 [Pedobacter soli]